MGAFRQQNSVIRTRAGFTLMEMLIVIAIIGALVGIAMPVFSAQIEQSRISADEAAVRNGYSLVQAQIVLSTTDSETTAYVYDASTGTVRNSSTDTLAASVSGYGQSSSTPTYEVGGVKVTGIPSGSYVYYVVKGKRVTSIVWGSVLAAAWSAVENKNIDNNWYDYNNPHYESKQDAYNSIIASTSNENRLAADRAILNAIAAYFNSLTVSEAQAILGSQYNQILSNNGRVIFSYCVDNSYSVRLNPDIATNSVDYLANIGYNPKIFITESGNWRVSETGFSFTKGTNNYVDTYLFTSDEVIGSGLGKDRQVWLTFKVSGNKIVNARAWLSNTGNTTISSNV